MFCFKNGYRPTVVLGAALGTACTLSITVPGDDEEPFWGQSIEFTGNPNRRTVFYQGIPFPLDRECHPFCRACGVEVITTNMSKPV